MNIVIDTNIFISSFMFRWKTEKFLKQLINNHVLCFSQELIDEIKRILINKFKAKKQYINEFEKIIVNSPIYNPKIKINKCRDKKDDFLLELAETCAADFIITWDKDLLVLQKWKNTVIVKPADFII